MTLIQRRLKSMQRHDVASTLRQRCINVMCPLGCSCRWSFTDIVHVNSPFLRMLVCICNTYEYVINVLHMRTAVRILRTSVRIRNKLFRIRTTVSIWTHDNVSVLRLRTTVRICNMWTKKVRERSREYQNHKPQPFPDTKRKRKQIKLK